MEEGDKKSVRILIISGAVCGCFSVLLGAMGAHALKNHLNESQLNSFETGVRFLFFHGLTLLLISALRSYFSSRQLRMLQNLFVSGILFFSVSIFLLSTKSLTGLDWIASFAWITPVGGLLLMAGWFLFFLFSFKSK